MKKSQVKSHTFNMYTVWLNRRLVCIIVRGLTWQTNGTRIQHKFLNNFLTTPKYTVLNIIIALLKIIYDFETSNYVSIELILLTLLQVFFVRF